MVEIEGSTTCIYMSIRLLNVLGKRGVCGDTTRGCRAFVVLHVGVNEQHFNILPTGTCLPVVRCVPVIRQTRRWLKAEDEIRVAFFDLFEKLENPVP